MITDPTKFSKMLLSLLVVASVCGLATAQEKPVDEPAATEKEEVKFVDLEAANGKLMLSVPEDWEAPKARSSRILEHELFKPAKGEPDERVRITMMAAGGSIDANIERWYAQFAQSDGKSTKEVSEVEKTEVDGATIHRVVIPGDHTMRIGGGPFAPGKEVKIEDARMLAAIIELEGGMQYFIKMTGPEALVEEETESFDVMLKELKISL